MRSSTVRVAGQTQILSFNCFLYYSRFKMLSEEVPFTLDYTPTFVKQPLVWEKVYIEVCYLPLNCQIFKVASPLSNVRKKSRGRNKRSFLNIPFPDSSQES